MKRLLRSVAVLLVLCLVGFTGAAHAHVLKQDNGVSAVLHIAPFDAPESNKATRIEIEFSNTGDTFSLHDYKIKLQLQEGGKVVRTYAVQPAYFGTATQGLATITFPKADVYGLSLSGVPTAPGQAEFAMHYDVRVTAGRGSAGPAKQTNQVEVAAISATVLVIFAMVATRQIVAGKRYAVIKKGIDKEKSHD